jgi:hypothetical protein
MAYTIHDIDIPITLEDVLRLREIEQGRSKYHQVSNKYDNSAKSGSHEADRRGALRERLRQSGPKHQCPD